MINDQSDTDHRRKNSKTDTRLQDESERGGRSRLRCCVSLTFIRYTTIRNHSGPLFFISLTIRSLLLEHQWQRKAEQSTSIYAVASRSGRELVAGYGILFFKRHIGAAGDLRRGFDGGPLANLLLRSKGSDPPTGRSYAQALAVLLRALLQSTRLGF